MLAPSAEMYFVEIKIWPELCLLLYSAQWIVDNRPLQGGPIKTKKHMWQRRLFYRDNYDTNIYKIGRGIFALGSINVTQ